MGTKTGPSYINLCVGYIEHQFFNQYNSPNPELYHCYIHLMTVSIVLLPLPERDSINTAVNLFHPALKYTWEIS